MPFLVSATLSPSPVSQIRVPLGWRIRKHGSTIVPGSPANSPVSEKREPTSFIANLPQSIAYRRTFPTLSAAKAGASPSSNENPIKTTKFLPDINASFVEKFNFSIGNDNAGSGENREIVGARK